MPMVEGFICNGLSIGKADIGDFQPMAMVEMSHAVFNIPSGARKPYRHDNSVF